MWTRARFNKEILPGYFTLMIDSHENKRAESMWSGIVDKKTSKKAREQNIFRSGLGFPVKKGEGAPVTYDTQIAGAEQTWVHDVFALAVRLTEEAIEDNLYELNNGKDGLKDIFFDLGEALAENKEVLMARFLNSGGATTYHTTRNAKALFDTTHPRLDGSTFSNKATSADLTYTAFWTAVVAAENQYNHRQYRTKRKIKDLWIPPQLEQKALEILKSTDRPDTANRAVNALAKSGRQINLKNWSYLTDEDAWYLKLSGKGILYFDRRKTRFARDKDFQTGDLMVKGDQRWSAEIDDPQGWYGVIPT